MEPLPRQVGVFLACAAGRSPMLYVQPKADIQTCPGYLLIHKTLVNIITVWMYNIIYYINL